MRLIYTLCMLSWIPLSADLQKEISLLEEINLIADSNGATGPTGGAYYEEDYPDDGYAEDVIWVGPGWYYGFWFGTDYDYYNWCRGHRRYYRHYYYGNHPYGGYNKGYRGRNVRPGGEEGHGEEGHGEESGARSGGAREGGGGERGGGGARGGGGGHGGGGHGGGGHGGGGHGGGGHGGGGHR
jgi:hypothetical protein